MRTRRRLDYLELPFTEYEIRTALGLVWPKAEAKRISAHFATVAPIYVRDRYRRWAYWRRHGERHRRPIGGWMLPPELFPLLTLVSPSAARRVERLMVAHWRSIRNGYIYQEQCAAAVAAGLMPGATADMIARAEARVEQEIQQWRSERRRLARLAREQRAS